MALLESTERSPWGRLDLAHIDIDQLFCAPFPGGLPLIDHVLTTFFPGFFRRPVITRRPDRDWLVDDAFIQRVFECCLDLLGIFAAKVQSFDENFVAHFDQPVIFPEQGHDIRSKDAGLFK
jgi:hypothetical protein